MPNRRKTRWPPGHGSIRNEFPEDKHAIKPRAPAWGAGGNPKEKEFVKESDTGGKLLTSEAWVNHRSSWRDYNKYNTGQSSSSGGDYNRVPEHPKRHWDEPKRDNQRSSSGY